MGYYLLDHPKDSGPDYYTTRLKPLVACVIHITAGLEDLDGVNDQSAEATARYAATTVRDVSWHSGSDTDSALDLLPWAFTAWHCRDYNSGTAGHEISKYDADWRDADPAWVEATLRCAADHLRPKLAAAGIPIRKATRAEVDHAIATGGPPVGLVGHWELNPDTRNDPGRVGAVDTFPWTRFLQLLKKEDDTMRTGDSGPRVAYWQARLVTLGIPCTINSSFDTATVNATKTFQRAHGLADDGEVQGAEWSALTEALSARNVVQSTSPIFDALEGKLDEPTSEQARKWWRRFGRWHDRQHAA